MSVHYINNQWNLVKRIIFTTLFEDDKKSGENIKREMTRKFCELGFSTDLFDKITYVTDQGPNILKALENQKRLNCTAHLINTVLRNAFSEKHSEKIPHIHNLVINCKDLVTYFKQSGKVSKLSKTLQQSVETRWNSIFIMLNSVLFVLNDIKTVLREQNNSIDQSDFDAFDIDENLLKELIGFLEIFDEATKELESDTRPTIHKVALWKEELLNHCKFNVSDSSEIKILKKICVILHKSKV